jgi:hypothetical protein
VTTTLNPSDTVSGVTFSNGNLTGSWSTSGSGGTTRATTGKSSGKWVIALKYNTVSDFGPGFGFCNATYSTSNVLGDPGVSQPNADNFSLYNFGWMEVSGNQIKSGLPQPTNGVTRYIAFDIPNRRIYTMLDSDGVWWGFNGALTGGVTPDNDTTGAAAFDFSGVLAASETWYPAVGWYESNGVSNNVTLDPAAVGHGLSTYSPWDTTSNPSFTFTGASSAAVRSASAAAYAGSASVTLKSAMALASGGAGSLTPRIAASLKTTSVAAFSALMAAKLSATGVASLNIGPSLPTLAISGASSAAIRAAMKLQTAGVGTFTPSTAGNPTPFSMAGAASISLLGNSFGWSPASAIGPMWTVQPGSGATSWHPQSPGSQAWTKQ